MTELQLLLRLSHSPSLSAIITIEVLIHRLAYSVRNRNVSAKYILHARDVHVWMVMELPRDGSVCVAVTLGSVLTHA